jgi:hypothetical protein
LTRAPIISLLPGSLTCVRGYSNIKPVRDACELKTMDQNELRHLKSWFSGYCASFSLPDAEDQRNLKLKEDHTRKVCENMQQITRDLSLGGGETALAETIALFHDVGRFPQYQEYRTFRDSISVNHAALGTKVLLENKVLKNIPRREQKIVIDAVTLHNVFVLPEGLDEDTLLYARLIRDSDKLDIWRVFTEYYELPEDKRWTAAGLGLPDTPDYSPDILPHLHKKEMFLLSKLKTLNDFKLLQIVWIFDLNFTISFRMLAERDYLNKIAAALPATDEIKKAVDVVREFVDRKSHGGA